MLLHRRMMGNTTKGGGSSDGIDYSKQYFTMEAVEDTRITIYIYAYIVKPIDIVSYSLDEGKTWTTYNNVTSYINTPVLTAGSKILWKILPNIEYNNYFYLFTFGSQGKVNVFGNLMSLFYFDDFENKSLTLINQCDSLFTSCDIVEAKNLVLPNNTTDGCYYEMFAYNIHLVSAPVLIADTLNYACYEGMFRNCYSIECIELFATQYNIYDSWMDVAFIFDGWLDDVAPIGVLKRKREFTAVDSYIPDGWTVEYLN